MNTGKNTKYLGWTNRETWNVMLWINNRFNLYVSVVDILEHSTYTPTYKEVINILGIDACLTGDGVSFLDENLNYEELNETIKQMKEEL